MAGTFALFKTLSGGGCGEVEGSRKEKKREEEKERKKAERERKEERERNGILQVTSG